MDLIRRMPRSLPRWAFAPSGVKVRLPAADMSVVVTVPVAVARTVPGRCAWPSLRAALSSAGGEGDEFHPVAAAGGAGGHGGVEGDLVGDVRRQRLAGGTHGGGEAGVAVVQVVGLVAVGSGESRGGGPGDGFVVEAAVAGTEAVGGADPLAARGHGVARQSR